LKVGENAYPTATRVADERDLGIPVIHLDSACYHARGGMQSVDLAL
jgi:hypothetical protein